tara:strand:+ start:387 stop:638 length:252 start_codon:yes stop_codon:yes gene_type:complete
LKGGIMRDKEEEVFEDPDLQDNFGSNFLVFISLAFAFAGLVVMLSVPKLLGGDAYNYITAAGRGTALVCIGIIFAILSVTYRK